MVPIRPQLLHGLAWRQDSAFHRHFQLKAGDSVLAELDFLKTFGTLARGRTAGQCWTFKRTGFLSPLVTARIEGSDADLAVYHPNFFASRGELRLSQGETLELKSINFWAREWLLTGGDHAGILRLHNKGLLRQGAEVEVLAPGREDVALLLLMSWYILVLQMQDTVTPVASS